jgi:hypothetical protein
MKRSNYFQMNGIEMKEFFFEEPDLYLILD